MHILVIFVSDLGTFVFVADNGRLLIGFLGTKCIDKCWTKYMGNDFAYKSLGLLYST